MSFINPKTKEVNCKIVYFGPPFSGKSTSLKYVYKQAAKGKGGRLISLSQEADKTLFFDFLPLSLGEVNGYKIRLHLYTVPGHQIYDSSRKIILKGVDGVVFVADSQIEKFRDNIDSLKSLEGTLRDEAIDFSNLPMVFQYNKRDLRDIIPVKDLRNILNIRGLPDFEASATKGMGVMETARAIAKEVLKTLA